MNTFSACCFLQRVNDLFEQSRVELRKESAANDLSESGRELLFVLEQQGTSNVYELAAVISYSIILQLTK